MNPSQASPHGWRRQAHLQHVQIAAGLSPMCSTQSQPRGAHPNPRSLAQRRPPLASCDPRSSTALPTPPAHQFMQCAHAQPWPQAIPDGMATLQQTGRRAIVRQAARRAATSSPRHQSAHHVIRRLITSSNGSARHPTAHHISRWGADQVEARSWFFDAIMRKICSSVHCVTEHSCTWCTCLACASLPKRAGSVAASDGTVSVITGGSSSSMVAAPPQLSCRKASTSSAFDF
mmetsp:Transcript_9401/g.22571  ORF Transcript_9401/g.22571 Transcript_9401/m.22571 type:complete len:232 (+) Transcript_9401:482-1177(+)